MKKYYVYNTFSQKCELTEVNDQVYTELKRMDWRQEKHSEVIEDKEIPFSALEKTAAAFTKAFVNLQSFLKMLRKRSSAKSKRNCLEKRLCS